MPNNLTKFRFRLALLGLDFCLILLVLLIVKNTLAINVIRDFHLTPEDIIPELTKIPTLESPQILGLTSFEIPKAKKAELQVPSQVRTLLSLVNTERQKNGLPALTLDPALTNLAQNYSQKMSSDNFFSHTNPQGKNPFQRLSDSGISFQTAGENIAYAPEVNIAHTNFMNSAEHKSNILSPDFSKIGIGIYQESPSKTFFTEIFTN